MSRVFGVVRSNWWVAAAAVVAVMLALAFGWGLIGVILLPAYAVLNGCGVAIYCDALRGRRASLQLVLKLLAVVLVPVGMVTALLKPGGLTPTQAVTTGSMDEGVRNESARVPSVSRGQGGGSFSAM